LLFYELSRHIPSDFQRLGNSSPLRNQSLNII